MEPSDSQEQRSCCRENLETQGNGVCSPYNGNLQASQDLHTGAVGPTWLKTFPGVSAGSPIAARPCSEEKQEIRRVVGKERRKKEGKKRWRDGATGRESKEEKKKEREKE